MSLTLSACGSVSTGANDGTSTPEAVAPAIQSAPVSQTVSAGSPATFTVTAIGTDPLNFEWQRNGVTIAGVDGPSFTVAATTPQDNGDTFSVIVSNVVGMAQSAPATLTVMAGPVLPSITTQPANESITAGQSAAFTVVATGTAPLGYQWQRDGAVVLGATAATYTTPVTSTGDNGSTFTVTVSNAAGVVQSAAAVLTVTAVLVAPTITTQPADRSVTAGAAATFTVTATGSTPLAYQWQKGGTAIVGATSSTYKTPAESAAANGTLFSVVVSNAAGSVQSGAAKLSVTPTAVAPLITTQPASQSVAFARTATFSVTATGTAPLAYQWRRNGNAIAGATSATYTTPEANTADNGELFSVVVSNSAGTVTSGNAELTVGAPPANAPTITSQPASQTIAAGTTATFAVTATGSAPLGYQWRKNGTAIAGASSSTYTTPAETTADNGALFSVVVSNSAGSVTSANAALAVTGTSVAAPVITTQPASRSVTTGSTATFAVVASGTAPLAYQWRRNGTAITGATSATYTTAATTTADNGAVFSVVVSNSAGSVTSANATLTVTTSVTGSVDVTTYKYDNSRTGQNVKETTLTPANVTAATFGLLRQLTVDGKVDAQPLYLSALTVGGAVRNVLFVATENDSVYAFDADTGAQLWKVSLIPAGETVSDNVNCNNVIPTIGITSTPVIDRTAGTHGTMYVVAMTQSGTTYHHRLHALDLSSGGELLGGPTLVTASYQSNNGVVQFNSSQGNEHAAMLLSNGTLYTTWTSHCDHYYYAGWIMAYNASTLQQTSVLNVGINSGGIGPAIWMAGSGPMVDSSGNLYLITANGGFEASLDANGFPNMGDFGNSFMRISTAGGLKVADYFAPYNTAFLSQHDLDLGGGGNLMLPSQVDSTGQTRNLMVGAGKDGNLYVVDRDSMGHFTTTTNNNWQTIPGVFGNRGVDPLNGTGGVWSTPAYFNGRVYYSAVGKLLMSFSLSKALLSSTPLTNGTVTYPYPGASPSVSANGTSNGIVWALYNATPAVLYALDATTLAQLYSSSDAANGRDQFGAGNKFIVPVVANGKVFVGTTNSVAVFGLLN